MSQNEKYFGNWIILFESNDNEIIQLKLNFIREILMMYISKLSIKNTHKNY